MVVEWVPNSFQVQIFKERTIFEWLCTAKLYFTVYGGDQFYVCVCGCVCVHLHVSFLPPSSDAATHSILSFWRFLNLEVGEAPKSSYNVFWRLFVCVWHVGQVVKEQRDDQQDFYFYVGMYVRKLNVDSSKAPYLWRKWREHDWAEEKLGCDASHPKTLAILVHGELWSSEGPTEMSWIGTRGQTSRWVQWCSASCPQRGVVLNEWAFCIQVTLVGVQPPTPQQPEEGMLWSGNLGGTPGHPLELG